MALQKNEPLRGFHSDSLMRKIARLEEMLNAGRDAIRKKFPRFPMLEKPRIESRPNPGRKGKKETGQCPAYVGEEECVSVEEGVGEEWEENALVVAAVRFPEKKAEGKGN